MSKSLKNKKRKNKEKKGKRKTKKLFFGGELDNEAKLAVTTAMQNRSLNLAKMLSVACKNPDSCLAIGKYAEIVKTYFEDFRNLSYVDMSAIEHIGNPSANGFILEMPFVKNNYTSYTALKCSATQTSDNLFYEYYVGKFFINKYLNIYPCFVETYDCYRIKDDFTWSIMNNQLKRFKKMNDINNDLSRLNVDVGNLELFSDSCVNSRLLSVLIQHFDNFNSIGSEFDDNYANIKYDLLNIMFQVYFPLCALDKNYTHYDLHSGNVFLYKPYGDKEYMLMRYHDIDKNGNERGVYEFPSEYMVKIIDYGRNYFNNGTITTKTILKNSVCSSPKCKPHCGANFGYEIIQGNEYDPNYKFYDLMPNIPNVSSDLRLAYLYDSYLIKVLKYTTLKYDTKYGTPEIKEYNVGNPSVQNIHDLLKFLKFTIQNWNYRKITKKYTNKWKCVATIDIYNDGREYSFKYATGNERYTPAFPILSKQDFTNAIVVGLTKQSEAKDKLTQANAIIDVYNIIIDNMEKRVEIDGLSNWSSFLHSTKQKAINLKKQSENVFNKGDISQELFNTATDVLTRGEQLIDKLLSGSNANKI